MKMYKEKFEVQSNGLNPTFHNLQAALEEIVAKSGVKEGTCTVYSHHTTCSVMIQECSHDQTYYGLEFLQQDLCNIMEKLIPTCHAERQYMHPGPEHIEFGAKAGDPAPWCSLNTDAHLRSCLFGRSETIIIEDGKLDMGQFGFTYLVDWDQVRARKRVVQVCVIGE